jgi:hypothetical protein
VRIFCSPQLGKSFSIGLSTPFHPIGFIVHWYATIPDAAWQNVPAA